MANLENLIRRIEMAQPSEEAHKFSEEEMKLILEDAIMQHNVDYTVETLPKEEEHLVVWLTMSVLYYQLAGKTADNIRFRIQNDEYHGQSIPLNYFRMAQAYEKKYNENRNIQVNTVTRRQVGTGLYAPYYPGDRP